MPLETLPASSEMVPVGAIEVTRPLRMPWRAMASRTSSGRRCTLGGGQEALGVVEREGALLARQLGAGADRRRCSIAAIQLSASATASGVP